MATGVTNVQQSPATDGAGPGSTTAVVSLIWIIFGFATGVPLALVGKKLSRWRIPQAMGIALAAGVLSWASIINTVSAPGISDIGLVGVVGAFMAAGFVLGSFAFMCVAGMALLGMVGGFSLGLRIVLFKRDLLIPILTVNWVIVAILAAGGGFLVLWKTKAGLLVGMTSAGTFLIMLALDLLLHGSNGVSIGLRHLFDYNPSHAAALSALEFQPTLSTQLILGISLALVPILAYAQRRVFREPPSQDSSFMDTWDPGSNLTLPTVTPGPEINLRNGLLKESSMPASRFSL